MSAWKEATRRRPAAKGGIKRRVEVCPSPFFFLDKREYREWNVTYMTNGIQVYKHRPKLVVGPSIHA